MAGAGLQVVRSTGVEFLGTPCALTGPCCSATIPPQVRRSLGKDEFVAALRCSSRSASPDAHGTASRGGGDDLACSSGAGKQAHGASAKRLPGRATATAGMLAVETAPDMYVKARHGQAEAAAQALVRQALLSSGGVAALRYVEGEPKSQPHSRAM